MYGCRSAMATIGDRQIPTGVCALFPHTPYASWRSWRTNVCAMCAVCAVIGSWRSWRSWRKSSKCPADSRYRPPLMRFAVNASVVLNIDPPGPLALVHDALGIERLELQLCKCRLAAQHCVNIAFRGGGGAAVLLAAFELSDHPQEGNGPVIVASALQSSVDVHRRPVCRNRLRQPFVQPLQGQRFTTFSEVGLLVFKRHHAIVCAGQKQPAAGAVVPCGRP